MKPFKVTQGLPEITYELAREWWENKSGERITMPPYFYFFFHFAFFTVGLAFLVVTWVGLYSITPKLLITLMVFIACLALTVSYMHSYWQEILNYNRQLIAVNEYYRKKKERTYAKYLTEQLTIFFHHCTQENLLIKRIQKDRIFYGDSFVFAPACYPKDT